MAKPNIKQDSAADPIPLDSEGLKVAVSMLDSTGKAIVQRESQAEQRVRLFLTLGAGSIGFLSLIRGFGELPGVNWYWATITFLAILLLYGLETVQSLNWKHIYTRVDSKLCNSLLSALSSYYPFVAEYKAILVDADKLKDAPSQGPSHIPWHKVRGSLAEFMYASNGLLTAAIVMMVIWGVGVFWTTIICLLTFLTSVWVQYGYSKRTRDKIPSTWV